MEALTTNWVGIAALTGGLIVGGTLIYLCTKGKIKSSDLAGIGAMIDKVSDILENFGRGDSIVNLFATYAAKAVRVVEQLVKNGDLEKDNELRKNEATQIVEQLALSDGVDLEIVHENKSTINHLIEAAVNEMQTQMQTQSVEIELDVHSDQEPSDEA